VNACGLAERQDGTHAEVVLAQAVQIPLTKTNPVRQEDDYGALQVFVPGKHATQFYPNKVY